MNFARLLCCGAIFFAALTGAPLPARAGDPCARMISLAPSITETAVALGLTDRLAGITPYCELPAGAPPVPEVGALFNPNLERMVALSPTRVFALREYRDTLTRMEALGFEIVEFEHRTLSGVLDSVTELGAICGRKETAASVRRGLEAGLAALRDAAPHGPPKRVLIVVGGMSGNESFRQVYVSGADGFYAELLPLLGAANVYTGRTVGIPSLSAEGVMRLDPDVILEIAAVPEKELARYRAEAKARWSALGDLRAVQDGRLHVLNERYAWTPGPVSVARLARKLSELVHGAR